MTIREILRAIRPDDSELLAYALDNHLTNQFVEHRPGRFIGVNILPELMPNLTIEQTAGAYSEGTITRPGSVETCNGES